MVIGDSDLGKERSFSKKSAILPMLSPVNIFYRPKELSDHSKLLEYMVNSYLNGKYSSFRMLKLDSRNLDPLPR